MRGPIQLIKDAWQLFVDRASLLVGIYVVPVILTLAYGYFTNIMMSPEAEMVRSAAIPFMVLVTIIFILVSIISGVALVRAVSSPEPLTIIETYRFGWEHVWAYTWLGFLVGLTVLAGFILLIIPGIIFMVWYGFSYFILLLEGQKGVAAMKASKALVAGKFWPVLGRAIVLVLVNVLVGAVVGFVLAMVLPLKKEEIEQIVNVVNVVMAPFSMAYAYLMYVDLKKTVAQPTVAAAPLAQ